MLNLVTGLFFTIAALVVWSQAEAIRLQQDQHRNQPRVITTIHILSGFLTLMRCDKRNPYRGTDVFSIFISAVMCSIFMTILSMVMPTRWLELFIL